MNMFDDTYRFVKSPEDVSNRASLKDILALAGEIKNQLGEKGYFINKYLSLVFEAANQTKCHEAASTGFEEGHELYKLCTAVLEHDNSDELVYYEQARQRVENTPLHLQERDTKINLYCAMLADEYLNHIEKEYASIWAYRVGSKLDSPYLNHLYENIAAIVGEARMEELNLLLKQRLFRVPPNDAFIQGYTNGVLSYLNYRDAETGRLVWELALENS